MTRMHLAPSRRSAAAFALLLVASTACSRKPCEHMGAGTADARLADLVPEGGSVCKSLGANDLQVEVKAGFADVAKQTFDKLETKGYAEDLNAPYPASNASGQVTRNFRKGFSGIRVTVMDSTDLTWLQAQAYPACPISEALATDTLEDSLAEVLAGKDDALTCGALRALVAEPDHLADRIKKLPGFLDAYRPIAEDPKELLALFAAARAEGRKVIVATKPKTFDDKAYEGKREALKALFKEPPAIVTIGGVPLGLFGRAEHGGTNEDERYVRFMWVTALDALHIAEPPAKTKTAEIKTKPGRAAVR